MTLWFFVLGSWVDSDTWIFRVYDSNCDRSGCTSALNIPFTYNPRGFSPPLTAAGTDVLQYCGFPKTCKFKDSNGLPPIGHGISPDTGDIDEGLPGTLATTNPKDWPDLARGLRNGWYLNTDLIVGTAYCPGVAARRAASTGIVGEGLPVCSSCNMASTCLSNGVVADPVFCFMCPSAVIYGDREDAYSIRGTAYWLLTVSILFTIGLFLMCYLWKGCYSSRTYVKVEDDGYDEGNDEEMNGEDWSNDTTTRLKL